MTDWVKVECPLCGEMAVAETHPNLKREWVGLTDEDFDFLVPYCCNEFDLKDYKDFAQAIEAKLKQKNGYDEEKNNG